MPYTEYRDPRAEAADAPAGGSRPASASVRSGHRERSGLLRYAASETVPPAAANDLIWDMRS
jgi:hypothetical protein